MSTKLIQDQSYEEIRAVVAFFEKITAVEQSSQPLLPELLMGLKRRGYGEGYLMPLGGHYEEIDQDNPVLTAKREGKEESGLLGANSMVAAKIIITIINERKKLLIDVVLFTNWAGTIKELNDDDEFYWLKFIPYNEIRWPELLPREKDWMDQVFVHHQPSLVKITCGKNRNEVINFEIFPL
jgi:hypothetical protein